MAYGPTDNNWLSSFEEECVGDLEAGGDFEEQLVADKELAAQRLWLAFQESANAVSHFYRDCQQKTGSSAWTPFHESASAVTQLYKDALEVCRAGIEVGIQQGQKKRNADIMAWAKKKRKVIKREELFAFLSDRPYHETPPMCNGLSDGTPLLCSPTGDLLPTNGAFSRTQTPTACSYVPANCSTAFYNNSVLSPRRGRSLLRDDPSADDFAARDGNGRKRQISMSFDYPVEQPLSKRGRL